MHFEDIEVAQSQSPAGRQLQEFLRRATS